MKSPEKYSVFRPPSQRTGGRRDKCSRLLYISMQVECAIKS